MQHWRNQKRLNHEEHEGHEGKKHVEEEPLWKHFFVSFVRFSFVFLVIDLFSSLFDRGSANA